MALVLAMTGSLFASQSSGPLSVTSTPLTSAKRGTTVEVKVPVKLLRGYHVNSNTPAEDYLIPLKLTWDGKPPLEGAVVAFPKPHFEKYQFSEKPLSVFTGDFEIVTKFKVPENAKSGMSIVNGKLRYQACTLTACLQPKTIDVKLPVEIR